MQKITKILATLGCCIALALPTQAAFEQTGNQSVRVSGSADPGAMVTLQVFKGDTGENIPLPQSGTYLNIPVCHDQTTADAAGYSFEFNIDGVTDTYTAYISFEGEGAPISETLYFINEEEVKAVLGELRDATFATSAEAAETEAADDTSVEDIITDPQKARVLGFTDEKGEGIKTDSLSKILFDYIKNPENNFTTDDRAAAIKVYEQCLFVQRLNEKKIENIFDELELSLISTDESPVKDWYDAEFVGEKLQKEMTENLSGKNFTKVDSYADKILEAFILATVEYPDGNDNMKDVLKEFHEEAGLDERDITTSVCSGLSGKDYANYEALQNAVDALTSGGGGGGGFGGSSSDDDDDDEEKVEIQAPVVPSTPTEIPEKLFSDLENVSWAEESINFLAEKGIVNGKGDGKFCPEDTVTREEFTKMIVEAFNIQGEADINFEDVSEDAWYHTYVEKAYSAGIIKGMSEESFGAGRNITRQDMAVICLNVAKAAGIDVESASDELFSDDSDISDYAKNAVYALKKLQIIGGMGDNTYQPQGVATRAQAAVILHRLLSI